MQTEKFNRFVVMSAVLHAALGLVVLISPSLFPVSGDASWGTSNAGGDGVNVRIVSDFSGIPLPAPAVVAPNAAANESPGFYESPPPTPPPEPVADAIPIPDSKARPAKQPPRPPAPPTRTEAEATPATPSNAVPYGQGGRPALQYGQYSTGGGTVGAGFGDGAFGERYGAYVQAMTRRISENWVKSTVDSSVQTAPRVYVRFTIGRDGTISDFEIQQSSNTPSLDASATRAIRRSNPLPPLPPDFRGSSVTVSFYFEYTR